MRMKKSVLSLLNLVAKIFISIVITVAIALIISKFAELSFNKVIDYAAIGLMVIGVVCVLENYRFSIVMGATGLIVLLMLGSYWVSEPSLFTMEDKLEDYEYLYDLVSENYPYLKLNERVNGINWLEEKEIFESAILKTTINNIEDNVSESIEDSMFAAEISKIVRRLNNSHTHVVGKSFFTGHRVHTSAEYDNNFKLWNDVLENEKTLNWYDFDIEEGQDTPSPYKRDLESKIFLPPGHWLLGVSVCKTDVLVPDEVAYLRIHSMDPNRIEEDGKIIRKLFEEVKDYNKLIIDIRGNRGGDDDYWRKNVIAPLINEELSVDNYFFVRGTYSKSFYESRGIELHPISELDKGIIDGLPEETRDFDYYGFHNVTIEPLNPVGFQGEIYLLVDRGVSASAENFASFGKSSGFATLVGKPTGGNGLLFEPLLVSLPNSGLVIRFRGELALNGDGNISAEVGTMPHIQLENAAISINYDVDSAVQYVINLK